MIRISNVYLLLEILSILVVINSAMIKRREVLLKAANDRFMSCCLQKKIPDKCLRLCKYEVNPDYAYNYFIEHCDAIDVAKSYFGCANQYMENTECCRYKNVQGSCCAKYLGFNTSKTIDDDTDLIGECYNIFAAVMTCPLLWHDINIPTK